MARGPDLAKTAGMDVVLSAPSASDAAQFIDEVRDSRSLHRPWLDLPDTPGRFAAYLDRSGREDQANYLIRHRACGGLVGVVNISNIVRGGLQSGYLGYGAFASHDVADVRHADQATAGAVPDQVVGLVVAIGPVQVGREASGRVRKVEPRMVQRSAGVHRVDELRRIGGRGRGQDHVHARSLGQVRACAPHHWPAGQPEA